MAQTTGAKSMRNVDVHYSTTSSWVWNEISGTVNAIEVSGGDRITGEAYTAEGETAIVLFGKIEPYDVTGRIVYSETTAEAFVDLEALYAAGTDLKLSWAPGGWATGNLLYRTTTTNLVNFAYPGGDVEAGDPILIEFGVRCNDISYARMTTASGTY
jgi:hypothetical protein